MACRVTKCCVALLMGAFLFAPGARAAGQEVSQDHVRHLIGEATRNFHDLTMNVRIAYSNQEVLEDIGKDFGLAYKFRDSKLFFKMPDMFKMTARAGFVNVTYIITGNIKRIEAGIIRKTEDISKAPHKKQTVLDVGVVSDSIWDDFIVDGVKKETYEGKPVYVIEMHLSNSPLKKEFIWVDAHDFRLLKREKYEADHSLRMRFVYSKHKRYKDAVWIPSEVRAYDGKGRLGGTSVYSNIKVNTGLTKSDFE